jgi:hypothetical protein
MTSQEMARRGRPVGSGQAMTHSEATIEDVIRMAYNTPTYTTP